MSAAADTPIRFDRNVTLKDYAARPLGPIARVPPIGNVSTADGTWLERLAWSKSGKGEDACYVPASKPVNAITIFVHDPRWRDVLAYDAFAESIVARRMPPWDATLGRGAVFGDWQEEDVTRATAWLQLAYGISLSDGAVLSAISVAARGVTVHPVREYLRGLEWDGVERIDKWLGLLGVTETPYSRAVGKCFLLAAVARVLRPGCKADTMMVLEGKTGIKKSTALNILAGDEWFCEISGSIDPERTPQLLRRKWIIEFGELAALRRTKDQEIIKSFLSRRTDTYRPPYGRLSRDFPRQNVFAGSTNESEYLYDATGGRRFHPVLCTEINARGLEIERDQLWAEAVVCFDRGDPWYLTDDALIAESVREQGERYDGDVWTDKVSAWSKSRLISGLTTDEVLADCLGLEVGKWDHTAKSRVGRILRVLGWVPRGTDRPRRYHPS